MVGVVLVMPFVLLFGVAPGLWLRWVNPDPQVVELAAQYLRITAPALLLIQVSITFEASLRALGNTTLPLLAGALSVVINVALNYVLIFGHFGFPALGVAGAAWGTLVARALQMLFILAWIYGRNHGFALRWSHFQEALAGPVIKRFVAFSLPLMVNYG